MVILTMPFISCKQNGVPKDDGNNKTGPWIQTVYFKADGKPFEIKKNSDDNRLIPHLGFSNDRGSGLLLFSLSPEDGIRVGFQGYYFSGSSSIQKEGVMNYTDPGVENYHYSSSDDMCDKDSFTFEVRKQRLDLPGFYRYTGTFSGRLAYYYTDPFSVEIQDPCATPQFIEITEGKFDLVAVE